jgi:DNA-binding GntR family transcriptional regulator
VSHPGEQPPSTSELPVLTLGPHRTVEQVVVAKLREAIITGALSPGDRLAYRDLAQRFGVSVTPVRIALRELANEGLVEMRAHAGARVSPLSLDELEEIFATRIGIEGWLARHGAECLTDEALGRMASLLGEMRQAERANDRESYLRGTWASRTICYEAAGKERLLDRFQTLYALSTRYHFLTILDASRFAQSLELMEDFFAACRERDGARAERVMQDALEWTLSYLSDAVTGSHGSLDT